MSDATVNLTFSSPIDHLASPVVRPLRSGDLDAIAADGDRGQENRGARCELRRDSLRESTAAVNGAPPSARNVAEPTRAKQAVKDEEEHVRLLLDSAAEAICEIDRAGNCTFANPACAKLLGYAVVGHSCVAGLAAHHAPAF